MGATPGEVHLLEALQEPNEMLLYAAAGLVALAVVILIAAAIIAARKPKKPPTPTVAVRKERVMEPYVEPKPAPKLDMPPRARERNKTEEPIVKQEASPPPLPVKKKIATMRCLSGQGEGQVLNIGPGGVIIGRDPRQSQFVFTGNSSDISRAHCKVSFDVSSGTFNLEDLGSTNGTFLSADKRLEPRRGFTLNSGDRFYVSSPVHTFELAVNEE